MMRKIVFFFLSFLLFLHILCTLQAPVVSAKVYYKSEFLLYIFFLVEKHLSLLTFGLLYNYDFSKCFFFLSSLSFSYTFLE